MSIEKVKQIARETFGKELTDEQAARYAGKQGRLSDDELDNVSGGGCTDGSLTDFVCPDCGTFLRFYKSQLGSAYICPDCGYRK